MGGGFLFIPPNLIFMSSSFSVPTVHCRMILDMEEPSKPVPKDDAPWAKGKGPPFSFFPQSFRSFLSFPFVCFFGLVRFLLLSTQFSVFVRDHLRRKDRYKFCGGAAVKGRFPLFH